MATFRSKLTEQSNKTIEILKLILQLSEEKRKNYFIVPGNNC